MREKQKAEAKKRLRILEVLPEVIDGIDNDLLYCSERQNKTFPAVLYYMTEEMEEKVKEVEQQTGIYVYHIQVSYTEFGTLWSMLYVSKYEEEWDLERSDLKDNYAISYVWNETCDFGEFGGIQIISRHGGVERIG